MTDAHPVSDHRKLTQAEFLAELTARFGPDPMDWAFRCRACGDTATGRDFREAIAAHPRQGRDGEPVTASDLLSQECIGRTLESAPGLAAQMAALPGVSVVTGPDEYPGDRLYLTVALTGEEPNDDRHPAS